jgi:hypothetical protein
MRVLEHLSSAGLGRPRFALPAAAAVALLVLGLGAPQASAQGRRPILILTENGVDSPDPEVVAARRLLASQNVVEAAFRAVDLRLVQLRERALDRADADFRRGDVERGNRQLERASRTEDRRDLTVSRRGSRRFSRCR